MAGGAADDARAAGGGHAGHFPGPAGQGVCAVCAVCVMLGGWERGWMCFKIRGWHEKREVRTAVGLLECFIQSWGWDGLRCSEWHDWHFDWQPASPIPSCHAWESKMHRSWQSSVSSRVCAVLCCAVQGEMDPPRRESVSRQEQVGAWPCWVAGLRIDPALEVGPQHEQRA